MAKIESENLHNEVGMAMFAGVFWITLIAYIFNVVFINSSIISGYGGAFLIVFGPFAVYSSHKLSVCR